MSSRFRPPDLQDDEDGTSWPMERSGAIAILAAFPVVLGYRACVHAYA
jgi:hypothetical protein